MRISDWSSDVCSSDLGPEADLVATEMRAAAGPLGTVTEARAAKIVPIADVTAWLAALGGRDNLAEVAANPSRLMLRLRDDAVDDAVLATLGVRAVARTGGMLHLIVPDRSEEHTSELQSLMR